MSEITNSQLSPLLLVLDSSQAAYLSEDGSTAKFDLSGSDLDFASNKEAKTAIVNLHEFRCSHTIYNIDYTCNTLELFVQYVDVNFVPQPYSPLIITIPVGSYDDESLVAAINLSFKREAMLNNTDAASNQKYFKTFGNFISTDTSFHGDGIIRDFILDNDGNKIYNTGKFKFCCPSLESMTSAIYANHTHYYDGFYIVVNTYTELPRILGFPIEKAEIIPNTNNKEGFGVSFQMLKSVTQITYTVNKKTVFFSNQLFPLVELDTTNFGTEKSIPTLLCPSLPKLDYPREIYISVDNLRTRNRCSNTKISGNTLLAKVPFQAAFGDVFSYEPFNASDGEFYVPGMKLDSMTVRLVDEEGESILWNGSTWTLIIHIRYAIDAGSAGFEDSTLGRDYRPFLQHEYHDSLQTIKEHKKSKRII